MKNTDCISADREFVHSNLPDSLRFRLKPIGEVKFISKVFTGLLRDGLSWEGAMQSLGITREVLLVCLQRCGGLDWTQLKK